MALRVALHVAPAHGGFNNISTSGVVSMFEKEGFEAVGLTRNSSARVRKMGAEGDHVVMQYSDKYMSGHKS